MRTPTTRLGLLLIALALGVAALALTLGRERRRVVEPEAPLGPGAPAGRAEAALPTATAAEEPPARESGALRALRGAVVAAPEMKPVEGVALRLGGPGAPPATATSDAEGAFTMLLDAGSQLGPAVELAVDAPTGLWVARRPTTEELARERGALARVVLAPGHLAPFRGRVRDANTGQPLPEFTLRVISADHGYETLVSDAEGRVRARGLWPGGEVRVNEMDVSSDGWQTTHLHAPRPGGASEVAIPVEVGPTYEVELELPEGLELHHFGARLVSAREVDALDSRAGATVQLRPGEPPWVRLPQTWWVEPPVLLVVQSDGGGWIGAAPAPTLVGRHPTPVRIELERRARLRGRVLDADGVPQDGALVALTGAGPLGAGIHTHSTPGGVFVLSGVPGGPCTIQARHPRAGEAELTLLVDPAAPPEPELRLEPYPVGGDVEGVVRSTSGGFRGELRVWLTPLDPERGLLARRTTIDWETVAGEARGRFRFEALAAGRYTFHADARNVPYACLPGELELSPPALGLDVVVEDQVKAWRVYPMIWSSAPEPLSGVEVRLLVGGRVLHDGPLEDWPFRHRFREDAALEWSLRAPGHLPASGGAEALTPDRGRPVRSLRVRLEPTPR